jgi:colanic acid/amylovoran biosynthesis glycosyltransferase
VKGAHTYAPLFREAERLLPISEHWKRRLLELGAPPEKIEVRHMGVDTEALGYRPRSLPVGRAPRVISVGRFVEKKGFDYGLRAVARAERLLGSSLEYHLVGDGPLRPELQRLAQAEGLAERVTFHGAKSSDEIIALLADAELLMAPSVTAANGDKEGIPMVLMEAMAQGVLVLSTLHSGIPELVQNGESGRLVPERDADALASALADLLRTPEQWPRLLTNARKTVEADFDSTRLALGLERSFAEIRRGE